MEGDLPGLERERERERGERERERGEREGRKGSWAWNTAKLSNTLGDWWDNRGDVLRSSFFVLLGGFMGSGGVEAGVISLNTGVFTHFIDLFIKRNTHKGQKRTDTKRSM